MSSETERLAREAERHRNEVDQTIDELKERLSVGQIVDELSSYIREGQGAEMANNLKRQVRDNPLALALIGAGVSWLLLGQGSRGIPRETGYRSGDYRADYRNESGSDGYFDPYRDTAGDAALYGGEGSEGSSWTSSASDLASDVADRAKSTASGIGDAASRAMDSLSGTAGSATDAVNRTVHDVRDAARRAGRATYRRGAHIGDRASSLGQGSWRGFMRLLQDEPLIVGGIAVALGAAVGAALPSTRTEDELMGDARDRVRDEAVNYGSDALHRVEKVASDAYEAGKEELNRPKTGENGSTTLAEEVASVATAATEAAKESAKKEGLR